MSSNFLRLYEEHKRIENARHATAAAMMDKRVEIFYAGNTANMVRVSMKPGVAYKDPVFNQMRCAKIAGSKVIPIEHLADFLKTLHWCTCRSCRTTIAEKVMKAGVTPKYLKDYLK